MPDNCYGSPDHIGKNQQCGVGIIGEMTDRTFSRDDWLRLQIGYAIKIILPPAWQTTFLLTFVNYQG